MGYNCCYKAYAMFLVDTMMYITIIVIHLHDITVFCNKCQL